MKIFMFVLFFLLIGGFFIISNEDIRLNSKDNVDIFFVKYSQWVDELVGNGKTVTGHVFKMEWLPNHGQLSEK